MMLVTQQGNREMVGQRDDDGDARTKTREREREREMDKMTMPKQNQG